MPVMTKDGRAVLFIHVPKAGGTTIEQLFVKSGWTMHFRSTNRLQPDLFPFLRISPQHYHAALLSELFKVSKFDLVFAMLREPVARFRSEFAMRNRTLDAAPADVVSAWADKQLARYADNPSILDNHLRPQSEFLLPGTERYRLEDGMEAMVADLNERFDAGLGSDTRHRMSSEKRGLPSSSVEVSAELRSRLADFYGRDFAELGYDA